MPHRLQRRSFRLAAYTAALACCVLWLSGLGGGSDQGAARAQGLCWDIRCNRYVTCGSTECAGSSSRSSTYRNTTRRRSKTYRTKRRGPSRAQILRKRRAAAARAQRKKMLRLNDAGLAFSRAGQYRQAVAQYEQALSACSRPKDCKIIRNNKKIASDKLWNQQYEEKRKREKAEMDKKKAAARQQIGQMLHGLGANWGSGGAQAPGGANGLDFGPLSGRTVTLSPPGTPALGKQGHDQTARRLRDLRDQNRSALTALVPASQSPKASADGKTGKPGEDLRTTTHHSRLAAGVSGTAAKDQAMRGFDTGGSGLAPLPAGIVDLSGRPVNMGNQIPKDIGAVIPKKLQSQVGQKLAGDAAWKQLLDKRQAIEQKRAAIKQDRKRLQDQMAKAANEAARQKLTRQILSTYQQEKSARDALFAVKMQQKAKAEKTAKEIEIVLIDGGGEAPPPGGGASGTEKKTEPPPPNTAR